MSQIYAVTYFYYRGYSFQSINSIDYISSFVTGVVGLYYLFPYSSFNDPVSRTFSRLYIDKPALNPGFLKVSDYSPTLHLTTIDSYKQRNTYVLNHYCPTRYPTTNINVAKKTYPDDVCWAGEVPSTVISPFLYITDCYKFSDINNYSRNRASFLQPWRSDSTAVNGHNITFPVWDIVDGYIVFGQTSGFHNQLSYALTSGDAGNDSGSFPLYGYNPAVVCTYASGGYANMLPFVSDHSIIGQTVNKKYWRLSDDPNKDPYAQTHVEYAGQFHDTFVL